MGNPVFFQLSIVPTYCWRNEKGELEVCNFVVFPCLGIRGGSQVHFVTQVKCFMGFS